LRMLTVGERGFSGVAGRLCWRYHANTAVMHEYGLV
jgi:hypothetical protein